MLRNMSFRHESTIAPCKCRYITRRLTCVVRFLQILDMYRRRVSKTISCSHSFLTDCLFKRASQWFDFTLVMLIWAGIFMHSTHCYQPAPKRYELTMDDMQRFSVVNILQPCNSHGRCAALQRFVHWFTMLFLRVPYLLVAYIFVFRSMHKGVTFHACAVAHVGFAYDQKEGNAQKDWHYFFLADFWFQTLSFSIDTYPRKLFASLIHCFGFKIGHSSGRCPSTQSILQYFVTSRISTHFFFRMPVKPKPSKVQPPSNEKQKECPEKALHNNHFHILCVAFVQHLFLHSYPRRSLRLLENDAANDPEREARMLP